MACLTAAGGRAASCARRQRVGSEGRWAWRVAVRGRAHSQSIAEQGDSHRSGEGGSIGMLQNSSSSGLRVGEGSATESPAACEEPSAARWVTPGDILPAVALLWLDSVFERGGASRSRGGMSENVFGDAGGRKARNYYDHALQEARLSSGSSPNLESIQFPWPWASRV